MSFPLPPSLPPSLFSSNDQLGESNYTTASASKHAAQPVNNLSSAHVVCLPKYYASRRGVSLCLVKHDFWI